MPVRPGDVGALRVSNRESLAEFDFTLPGAPTRAGVSALLRVRNEAKKLHHSLASVLGAFDEVVLVDNGSEDDTVAVARAVAERRDPEGRLRIFSYPFRLGRYGVENEATPEDSVHSLAYFNNWALSRCAFRYACKWDGDMVLRRRARGRFQRVLQRTRSGPPACWRLPGQTIYRDAEGRFFLARGEVNKEIMMFPNRPQYRFVKERHWERIGRPPEARIRTMRSVCFYELKFVDEEEFAHWSTMDFPGERKRREWNNFQLVMRGETGGRRFRRLPDSFLDHQIPEGGE